MISSLLIINRCELSAADFLNATSQVSQFFLVERFYLAVCKAFISHAALRSEMI